MCTNWDKLSISYCQGYFTIKTQSKPALHGILISAHLFQSNGIRDTQIQSDFNPLYNLYYSSPATRTIRFSTIPSFSVLGMVVGSRVCTVCRSRSGVRGIRSPGMGSLR